MGKRAPIDAEHERELANFWYGGAVVCGLVAFLGLLAFRSSTGPMFAAVFGAIAVLSSVAFVYHDRRSDRG